MISIATLLVAAVAAYAAWNLQSLLTNYGKARQIGFPVLICPASTNNILWIIFSVACRPLLSRFLPSPLYDRFIPAIYGWEFVHRNRTFALLGPTFVLVMPGKIELWTMDSELGHAIMTRRNAFLQSDLAGQIIGMFGPNLTSTNGDDWQRQRKIVAPLLNERISKSVWNESRRQADELLSSFSKNSPGKRDLTAKKSMAETRDTIAGVRAIAINVLGSVAYGKQQSWQQENNEVPTGYRLAYMDAILAVVENLVPATFVARSILTSTVMPKALQKVGYAVEEFPRYTKQLLEAERKAERPAQANLLSTLVNASDTESKTASKAYLSEKELSGNLFQFTIAGFDTTANTMAYAIALLAIHPEWQDWIREEIIEVTKDNGMDYEEVFPALKRCLALMFEVLRLYTPVAHIARSTHSPQIIPHPSGSTCRVPTDTLIYISGACMHVSSLIYGPDPEAFRPTRWLPNTSRNTLPGPEDEFFEPPRSSFLPWSAGPRSCPGQKMAEVEFVAVMCRVFGGWRVSPVIFEGETLEGARERLKDVVRDSQPRTTLQMNRPRDLVLRWEEMEG